MNIAILQRNWISFSSFFSAFHHSDALFPLIEQTALSYVFQGGHKTACLIHVCNRKFRFPLMSMPLMPVLPQALIGHHGWCEEWPLPCVSFLMVLLHFLWVTNRDTTSFFQFTKDYVECFAIENDTAGMKWFLKQLF